MKHTVSALFVGFSILLAPRPALAGPGTAKKATGIVLLSVGSAVGGVAMILGLLSNPGECAKSDETCQGYSRSSTGLMLLGGGIVAGSIVGGISLINAGRADQRAALGIGALRQPPTHWVASGRVVSPVPALKLKMDF